jgi:hypothetical protein
MAENSRAGANATRAVDVETLARVFADAVNWSQEPGVRASLRNVSMTAAAQAVLGVPETEYAVHWTSLGRIDPEDEETARSIVARQDSPAVVLVSRQVQEMSGWTPVDGG